MRFGTCLVGRLEHDLGATDLNLIADVQLALVDARAVHERPRLVPEIDQGDVIRVRRPRSRRACVRHARRRSWWLVRILADLDDVLSHRLVPLEHPTLINRERQNCLGHYSIFLKCSAGGRARHTARDRTTQMFSTDLQHLGDEVGARTNQGRARRLGSHLDRRVVRTESAGSQRIVAELVSRNLPRRPCRHRACPSQRLRLAFPRALTRGNITARPATVPASLVRLEVAIFLFSSSRFARARRTRPDEQWDCTHGPDGVNH